MFFLPIRTHPTFQSQPESIRSHIKAKYDPIKTTREKDFGSEHIKKWSSYHSLTHSNLASTLFLTLASYKILAITHDWCKLDIILPLHSFSSIKTFMPIYIHGNHFNESCSHKQDLFGSSLKFILSSHTYFHFRCMQKLCKFLFKRVRISWRWN